MGAKKKSVVMVCSQMPPVYGGAGAQAALLGRSLATMGWDVHALTLDQQGVGSGTDRGVKFRRLLRGVTPATRWTRLLTTLGLGVGSLLHVVVRRPTVVHIHGAYWWSILPAVAGRLVGAVVVIKLTRDGEDDAHTVYSKRIGRVPIGRLYGLPLSIADVVIVLNEQARNVAKSRGLSHRVRLVPNGVDEELLTRTTVRREESRAKWKLAETDRVVLFVGYLVRHKGVVDLLEAWRRLGMASAHLWLVGPVEGFYRELGDEIPGLIEALSAEGFSVMTFGHMPFDELPGLYWAADVFTLPSYAEGMPNSLAEALVAGCHAVATEIPGITDLMGKGSVDLVPPGDTLALANRLRLAIADPRPASSELQTRLRISAVAAAYDQMYVELTSAPRR